MNEYVMQNSNCCRNCGTVNCEAKKVIVPVKFRGIVTS